MLLDGVRYAAIAKRLAEAGIHVTAEHIRRWHEHGYKRWYAEYMQNQALRDARESALDILEVKAGPDVQDAGRYFGPVVPAALPAAVVAGARPGGERGREASTGSTKSGAA